MSEFYTYLWLRADATPYYVGKGKDNRAFSGQHSVPPPCRARILIQFWSSEQEAFDMEKFYIRLFGRKDNGTGILCNQTDGGEGCGLPEHYLAEHSRRMMGAGNPQFGKPSPGQPLATAAAAIHAREHPEEASANAKHAAEVSWKDATPEKHRTRTAAMQAAAAAKPISERRAKAAKAAATRLGALPENEIIALHTSGKTAPDVAQQLCVSLKRVRRVLKNAGVYRPVTQKELAADPRWREKQKTAIAVRSENQEWLDNLRKSHRTPDYCAGVIARNHARKRV
jgi:hypothetical protein